MIIKKWWLASPITIMILTACNQGASTETSEVLDDSELVEEIKLDAGPIEEEEEWPEAEDESNAADILLHSIEAMEQVDSYRSEISMQQEIGNENSESFSTDMTLTVDSTRQPLTMYQQSKVASAIPGISALESEAYFTSDGLFMKQSWMIVGSNTLANLQKGFQSSKTFNYLLRNSLIF